MEQKSKKRILYYDWNSLMQRDMLLTLQQEGYEVVLTTQRAADYVHDEKFMEYLEQMILQHKPEVCFSFNFFPVISKVCQRNNLLYVSWIFDSPALPLYSDEVHNSCNRIFHFDYGNCEHLWQRGVEHLYHLPLAARAGRTEHLLKSNPNAVLKNGTASWDGITFVGQIYDKKNFYDQIQFLPERLAGYLEGLMEAQKRIWGYNFLEECIEQKGMSEIGKYVKLECPKQFFYTPAFVFANLFLGQKLTAMEREEALVRLGAVAPVRLYSDSYPESLKQCSQLQYAGLVDSCNEAPLVYHGSKINLNMTLRTIRTGIPLRIFEIAEAGGFILTNYQQELMECFEPDKEIVIFGSMEEMEEKAQYYLTHEEERRQIAQAAERRLCAEHTLQSRIERLFGAL